jgi:hypothetical protein
MRLELLRKSHAKSEAQSTRDAGSSARTSASSSKARADERPNAPTDLIRSFWSLQMTSNDDALQWA